MQDWILDSSENQRISDLLPVANHTRKIRLSESTIAKIRDNRRMVEEDLLGSGKTFYGINTGFGILCDKVINADQLETLQHNLIRSHSCGTGMSADQRVVRWMILLKIISLAKGHSGVRYELIEFLIMLLNENILPEVPEQGSLGASGDLAPLSHCSLLCIGEGFLYHNGVRYASADFFRNHQTVLPGLKEKEGLALINGTQFSLAQLINCTIEAEKLLQTAIICACASLEAFNGNMDAFDERIHLLRNQDGQIWVASRIRSILAGSEIFTRSKNSVQDPYSFRCIPQVIGASKDAVDYVKSVAEKEISAVTDNPLIFENGDVLSGGNFHAQSLALATDFLKIALAEVGNIAERRMYQIIIGQRGLPDFLTQEPGVNSGYMIVQYSAASLVSYNKQLATPASVDSIVTSKGQEDHVSMAANAALQCNRIIEHLWQILAMEWMTASRAWCWRAGWNTSDILQKWITHYRSVVALKIQDHIPSEEYKTTVNFLGELDFPQ